MNTVNKGQLVETLASATGEARATVEKVLGEFISTVGSTLRKGDKIALTGFGTFEARKRPARTGRNPQTGQSIKIKASTVPAFKPGSGLKDTVSGAKKATPAKKAGTSKTSKAAGKAGAAKKSSTKTAAKKSTAKKTTAKKATAKKSTAKKAAKKR